MRKLLLPSLWLAIAFAWVGCGGTPSKNATHTSGIQFRAFVSNSVTASSSTAGLYIVNAATDLHPNIAPIAGGNTPGMMAVTPNLSQTLVYSGYNTTSPDNQFSIISNVSETNSAHVILPGYTESFLVSPDSSTAYVAVPSAPVVGQNPGAIEVVSLTTGSFVGEIDIPSVHYVSIDNVGDRLLAFSDNSDSVAIVTPSNIGTNQPVVTYVAGFDRPVQAFFSSDDTTAYVINCGAECGGNTASIQQLNMNTGTLGPYGAACVTDPTTSFSQCAATEAYVNGSTLYLAGTPFSSSGTGPSFQCQGAAGESLNCGMLTIFDLNAMAPMNTAPIAITDGYHNRIALGANGQLFIGASNCTEVVPPQPPPAGAEVRGCLAIYNTTSNTTGNVPPGGVVIPPANGDVTGIQPISNRNVVYVVQGNPVPGGSLYIYCTLTDDNLNCPATDKIQVLPNVVPTYAPLMVGNFYDVKTVDF